MALLTVPTFTYWCVSFLLSFLKFCGACLFFLPRRRFLPAPIKKKIFKNVEGFFNNIFLTGKNSFKEFINFYINKSKILLTVPVSTYSQCSAYIEFWKNIFYFIFYLSRSRNFKPAPAKMSRLCNTAFLQDWGFGKSVI